MYHNQPTEDFFLKLSILKSVKYCYDQITNYLLFL